MKKKYVLVLIVIGLCLKSIGLFAQDDKNKKKDDNSSTKIEIIQKNDYFSDGKKKKSTLANLIKINPYLLANGEIPVFYERRLGDKISAEIGIGPTFRNYMFDLFHYTENIDGSSGPFNFDNSTAKIGFSIRSEFRYYPDGTRDFPEASYFAIGLRFKSYGLDFQSPTVDPNTIYNNGTYTQPYNISATNTFTDLVVMYGNQVEYAGLYVDYYIGVGVRSRTISDLASNEQEFNDPTLGTYSVTTYSVVKTTKVVPLFTLGSKIGIAF